MGILRLVPDVKLAHVRLQFEGFIVLCFGGGFGVLGRLWRWCLGIRRF